MNAHDWTDAMWLLFLLDLYYNCYALLECDSQDGMDEIGEDMQPWTTGRSQTRVAELRTGP